METCHPGVELKLREVIYGCYYKDKENFYEENFCEETSIKANFKADGVQAKGERAVQDC